MRDFVTCFSENALRISELSCSPHTSSSSSSPSVGNMVTFFYLAEICGESRMVSVSWCKSPMGQGLSVKLDVDPSSRHCACTVDTTPWFFWKKRGSKTFVSGSSTIEVHWDLISAKYGKGPEPVKGFFVAVVSGRRLLLLLGDMPEEARARTNSAGPLPESVLVSRTDHVSGRSLYAIKAQFTGCGRPHDIVIECRDQPGEFGELSVRIDKKMVVQIQKLLWKFRGNQTIMVDGLHVDILWDVHDWLFNPTCGHAVFLFRTRERHSKSWLSNSFSPFSSRVLNKSSEEELEAAFSLFIYAWKSQ